MQKVFDLFAAIKDRVVKKADVGTPPWFGPGNPDDSKTTVALVDEAVVSYSEFAPTFAFALHIFLSVSSYFVSCPCVQVELWTRMIQHEARIQSNVLHEVRNHQALSALGVCRGAEKMTTRFPRALLLQIALWYIFCIGAFIPGDR